MSPLVLPHCGINTLQAWSQLASALEGFTALLGFCGLLKAVDQLFDASWVGDGAKLADVIAEGIDGGGVQPCQFVEAVAIHGCLVRFGDGQQGVVDTGECRADPFAGDICGDVFDELAEFTYAFGEEKQRRQ